MLVLGDRHRHDEAAEARVLHLERPVDVGRPVPTELLVEPADVGEHLPTERHEIALDGVARAIVGRLLELAKIVRHDAEGTDDTRRWIFERRLDRREDVARCLDRTVDGYHDRSERPREPRVTRRAPAGVVTEPDDLTLVALGPSSR